MGGNSFFCTIKPQPIQVLVIRLLDAVIPGLCYLCCHPTKHFAVCLGDSGVLRCTGVNVCSYYVCIFVSMVSARLGLRVPVKLHIITPIVVGDSDAADRRTETSAARSRSGFACRRPNDLLHRVIGFVYCGAY